MNVIQSQDTAAHDRVADTDRLTQHTSTTGFHLAADPSTSLGIASPSVPFLSHNNSVLSSHSHQQTVLLHITSQSTVSNAQCLSDIFLRHSLLGVKFYNLSLQYCGPKLQFTRVQHLKRDIIHCKYIFIESSRCVASR